MNMFPNKISKRSATCARVLGLFWTVLGIILSILSFGEEWVLKNLFIFVGVILLCLSLLIDNQIKLQSQLTRIEEKLDKEDNNSSK